MRWRRGIVASTAALFVAGLAASPALASKKDDTIRFATQQVPPNIDPYYNNLVIGAIIADQVWDALLYRDPDTGAFKPGLATAWRWIDDKTLELDLRKGVRFHNGAVFDAADVVYTLNFVIDPKNKVSRVGATNWIDHVEKVDAYKVRIFTKGLQPVALGYLSTNALVIHPHEYYTKVGPKGMNEHPVGTGPYRVAEYAIGKYIRLQRNPDYFRDSSKPRPKIEQVEIRFIPDPQIQVAEAISGGLDLIINVARDQAEQLRELPLIQVASGDTTGMMYLQMNTLPNAPARQLLDVRVRRAVSYAIDRPTLVKFMIGSDARLLQSECHPLQFGCTDAGVPRYPYDPAKAKALLAEAGYPNGFDIEFYAYRDRNQAEAIIGYLAAVGIRAHLRYVQVGAMASALRAGRIPIVLLGLNVGGASDVSTSLTFNHTFLPDDINRDGEIRDLVRQGLTMDSEARKAAYAKALKLIADRAYILPLYSLPNYYIGARDLEFKHHADGLPRFYEMSWK